jgi:hypothetical protein
MNSTYTMEKLAQQKLDATARSLRHVHPEQTTPRRRRTFRLPRVAWHRQVAHHA